MNSIEFPEGRAVYGDARMPNWPHRHRTPCPGLPYWACVAARRECFEVDNLSTLISPLLTGMFGRCNNTLPF